MPMIFKEHFVLPFVNHVTTSLPWDISADALTNALQALEPMGLVRVRRLATATHGFAWFIQFQTQRANIGNVIGAVPLLQVSIDPTDLVSSFSTLKTSTLTTSLTGTNTQIGTTTVIKGWNGWEQQTITISTSSGRLSGGFQLIYATQRTAFLPSNASVQMVQTAL